MTEQLEGLIRETLAGRAATVTAGPVLQAEPIRPHRHVWPAVAAAVAVLGLAGGLAVVQGRGEPTHAQAGGTPAAACSTTYPAAWQRAAHRLAVEPGGTVNVRAVTPTGDGIGEAADRNPRDEKIVVVPRHGAVRTLWRVSRSRAVLDLNTDGTSAVLAIAPNKKSYDPTPAVVDIAVIDLRTGHIRHVLQQAPIPAGQFVTWNSTVISNGVVYLLSRPRSSTAHTGTVISYSVRTGRYAVVARDAAGDPTPGQDPQLVRDIRGIGWRGGSIPGPAAPPSVPSFFSGANGAGRYRAVVSDGRTAAWLDIRDPHVVRWAAPDGARAAVQMGPALRPRSDITVLAVAGRFVFLRIDAALYTLDVRSHAVARGLSAGDYAALDTHGLFRQGTQEAGLLLGTAALPGLTCARH